MRYIGRLLRNGLIGSLLLSVVGSANHAYGQGRMTIQATAKGTSTQLGRMIDVNIYIEAYSTPDDRQTLIQAFKQRGQDGLVDALQDMKPKGRVRFSSGGVGNDPRKGADCVLSLTAGFLSENSTTRIVLPTTTLALSS
jgi:hypothetical protein